MKINLKKNLILSFVFAYAFIPLSSNAYRLEAKAPQRIVSLGSTLTEELYLLGAEENVVGVTIYCQRPAQAQTKEKIGSIKEVDLEKIVSLSPDLVLATSLTESRVIEKLQNLNIKVATFSYAKSFSQICADFLRLAKLVGKEKKGENIIQEAKNRVEAIRKSHQSLVNPKVFVQIGSRPLFSAGLDSFINDFIEFAGGRNIARGSRSGSYSREQVIKNNPDVIIIATMGIIGEREKDTWLRYKSINAAKKNRIYTIDSYKLCSPTPETFVETLETIVKILHPDLNNLFSP